MNTVSVNKFKIHDPVWMMNNNKPRLYYVQGFTCEVLTRNCGLVISVKYSLSERTIHHLEMLSIAKANVEEHLLFSSIDDLISSMKEAAFKEKDRNSRKEEE